MLNVLRQFIRKYLLFFSFIFKSLASFSQYSDLLHTEFVCCCFFHFEISSYEIDPRALKTIIFFNDIFTMRILDFYVPDMHFEPANDTWIELSFKRSLKKPRWKHIKQSNANMCVTVFACMGILPFFFSFQVTKIFPFFVVEILRMLCLMNKLYYFECVILLSNRFNIMWFD